MLLPTISSPPAIGAKWLAWNKIVQTEAVTVKTSYFGERMVDDDLDLREDRDLDLDRTLDLRRCWLPSRSHEEAVFNDSALIVPSSPGNRNVLQTSRRPKSIKMTLIIGMFEHQKTLNEFHRFRSLSYLLPANGQTIVLPLKVMNYTFVGG